MDEYCIKPGEVSRITGVSAITMRDWRRRGFLDGIGRQGINGRWLYCRDDVEIICRVASFLRNESLCGLAFAFATENGDRLERREREERAEKEARAA